MADFTGKFVNVFIGIIFGIVLLPTIQSSIDGAGLTGAAGAIADLIGLFVIIALVNAALSARGN